MTDLWNAGMSDIHRILTDRSSVRLKELSDHLHIYDLLPHAGSGVEKSSQ